MHIGALVGYSVSCYLCHHLLQYHYLWSCKSSIFTLFLADGSTYCTFLENCLRALQWSPVLVAAPLFLNPNAIPGRTPTP